MDIGAKFAACDVAWDVARAAEDAAHQAQKLAGAEFAEAYGRFRKGDEVAGFKVRYMRGHVAQRMRIKWDVYAIHVSYDKDENTVRITYSSRRAHYKGRLTDVHSLDGRIVRHGETQEAA